MYLTYVYNISTDGTIHGTLWQACENCCLIKENVPAYTMPGRI